MIYEPSLELDENWTETIVKNAIRANSSKSSHAVVEKVQKNEDSSKTRPCVSEQTQSFLCAAFMGGQGAKAGGIGYSKEVSPTLKSVLSGGNTIPDIVYPVALDCRNLIGNTKISGTLQAKNEGGYSLNFINPVVYDCRGNGSGDIVPNLTGDHENRVTDYTAICVGNGQMHQMDLGDKAGALNCMHDQQAVIHNAKPPRKYIVRRLTPTECARLQGFPDWWSHVVHKDSFTDEEYRFWLDVRNTHASVNGKAIKDYTKEQMLKWYNGLHTDSAEYKMWGNGIALPPALYVMQGIKDALERED